MTPIRELTDREMDAVAGAAPPTTSTVLRPKNAPFGIAVPTNGPSHENSTNLEFGVATRPIPVGAIR